ncbi:IS1634 family transposase [Gloeobacter morelensis]|uniref:IS1634 family transposase n=1 Tax=Gloeobacter morelensis MG652769 TaxID=2781736 RepID=A0ABY3PQ36_9CYAN|nr:IS1634 family transposase [Gloeobacter morelensis]UFP92717.1 IS1634 family transposase [Gloeobacter morelensis MG652769]UFP92797.1 IS1634 family transposase [Gloeobacter morelensis MG652769]UFP93313.1 IS1634 family transposase [Gloeobacter morelensis MG652769]UFP93614.1 IS1634 family transposase [Gloeobacter morelensis MG652769]UFP95818.1 IS1634 family transposase [Gloeobacter morelensis MG652769]
MSQPPPEIQVQNLDHLGIVAGIIDSIGLVEEVNQLLGTHPQEHVSCGQVLKGLILNGLGFVCAPLYLFEQFFVGKATEHLIGPGVQPEHFNDDRLGRVLDKLYEEGTTKVFVHLALKAARQFGIKTGSVHLDSTSFHVDGEYIPRGRLAPRAEDEPQPIVITHGYSRDHRPDLKQFLLSMITSGDGDVPLYLRVGNGNEADKAIFAQMIQDFRSQWDVDALFVVDSALYSAQNLSEVQAMHWLSRVPSTLTQVKHLLAALSDEQFAPAQPGYRVAEVGSTYAEIQQRWVVVASDERRKSDLAALDKKLNELDGKLGKELTALCKMAFACEADALEAAERFASGLKFHLLGAVRAVEQARHDQAGRPARGSKPAKTGVWLLSAQLVRNATAIEVEQHSAGKFVLATNVLDEQELSTAEVLSEYKAQQSVERGFRFLKDPLFFTSSVFLKSPERVEALAMVMGLCLLVYSLGQRQLRLALSAAQLTVKSQTKKPTATPTLRWIFQVFQAVHLLEVSGVKQVSNLSEERRRIVKCLGPTCGQYYLMG